MDPKAWAIRETHTKTLALVVEANLEDFVKSEGYVQVSSPFFLLFYLIFFFLILGKILH